MKKPFLVLFLISGSLLSFPLKAVEYFPILNLNYDTSQKLAMDLGVVIGPDDSHGLAVSIEPGVAGTKYHLGYSRITGVGVGAIEAYRVTLTGLHMYKTTGDFVSGRTYAGVDFSYINLPFVINFGLYRDPVTGNQVSMIGFGVGL